jgi:uncharacterized protein YbjT (DUF2867 family)
LSLTLCVAALLEVQPVVSLSASSNPQSSSASSAAGGGVNRRDALAVAGFGSIGLMIPGLDNNIVQAAENTGGGPIAVLGASGRTGALCVAACLQRSIPVRALTRTGTWEPPSNSGTDIDTNKLLSIQACDVKDPLAIEESVRGCRAVIYAASASKNGGAAKLVDNEAVVAAGNACLKGKVPRYVVLSSTATTRPKSAGYVFTNVFVGGNIMGEKRMGEEGVMRAYSSSLPSNLSYTIVRPGGLEEPKLNTVLGPSSLELSQGDALTGIISRADLAEVTVELALSNANNLRNTALEVYYKDSAQPCESKFKPLLENGGVRLHGDTYQELLQGIEPGKDYLV